MLGGASRSETCGLLGTGVSGVSPSQERSCHPLSSPGLESGCNWQPLALCITVFLKIGSLLGLLPPFLSCPPALSLGTFPGVPNSWGLQRPRGFSPTSLHTLNPGNRFQK